MYMAPIVRAEIASEPSALRRAAGLPVLALAGLLGVGWIAAFGLVALVVLLARFGWEATDYAGRLALGR